MGDAEDLADLLFPVWKQYVQDMRTESNDRGARVLMKVSPDKLEAFVHDVTALVVARASQDKDLRPREVQFIEDVLPGSILTAYTAGVSRALMDRSVVK